MITWAKRTFRNRIYPLNELLALIPLQTRVMDIGCGQGQFLKAVARSRLPLALGGLEVHQLLIEKARKELNSCRGTTLQLAVYSGDIVPATVAEYDLITLIDVLHHIPESRQDKFLRGLFKVMRPGAFLILKDIDAGQPFLCWTNKLHDLLLSGEIGDERSIQDASAMVEKSGFTVKSNGRRRILWYPHYWILAVKPSDA